MVRTLIIFVFAGFIVAPLVAVLVDNPGQITVDWLGYRLEMAMSLMAVVLFVAFVVVLIALKFVALILGGPAAWRKFFRGVRARQGMGALTQGLAAAAAGDATGARRHALTAERLANEGPLAQVLALEAAELEGRNKDVAVLARAMLDQPETALLGQRALFDLARKAGNEKAAVDEAEAAFENHPAAGWAGEALLADAIDAADWPRAKSIFTRADRHGGFINGRSKRMDATLKVAEAADLESGGNDNKALTLSNKAHDLDPTLTIAPVMMAQIIGQQGKAKKAQKIIEDAWGSIPHPTLGRIYAELFPEERQVETLGRLQGLVSLNSGHAESRLLFAQYAIAARNFTAGRDALKGLLESGGSARAYAAMAVLDRSEQGMAEASEDWMKKALAAPRDAVWICTSCGHPETDWSAVCPRCRSVGTLEWATHLMPPALGELSTVELDTAPELETPQAPVVEIEAASSDTNEQEQLETPRQDNGGEEAVDMSQFEEGARQPDDPGPDGTESGAGRTAQSDTGPNGAKDRNDATGGL